MTKAKLPPYRAESLQTERAHSSPRSCTSDWHPPPPPQEALNSGGTISLRSRCRQKDKKRKQFHLKSCLSSNLLGRSNSKSRITFSLKPLLPRLHIHQVHTRALHFLSGEGFSKTQTPKFSFSTSSDTSYNRLQVLCTNRTAPSHTPITPLTQAWDKLALRMRSVSC